VRAYMRGKMVVIRVVAALAEAVKSSDAALQEHALRALAGLVNLVNNHHVNSLLPLQQGLYLI
jgi:hypothetical protein